MDPHDVRSFSENLTNHNVLSPQERNLLASILRHARQTTDDGPSMARTVDVVLARAVGEVLLERAAEMAGRDVLEQIRQQSFPTISPGPPSPGPHRSSSRIAAESTAIALQEQPDFLRAECVVFAEFLAAQELEELTRYTLEREHEFHISEVISPGVEGGVVNPEYRRSRVLMDLGQQGERMLNRIQTALPRVLEKLGIEAFPITRVETQVTASNDGDFFRHHSDNAEEEIARRHLTFVYFFHREPKAFHGGELRLHDSRRENGVWSPTGEYRIIVPEQNQIVFFQSELLHEITPVICPSQAFADSRFTVNGWLHR